MNATLAAPPTLAQVHTDRFMLIPNSYRVFLRRFSFFLLGIFLPMLVLYCSLLQVDTLLISSKIMILGTTFLLLGGAFFLYWIKETKLEEKELVIQDGHLMMEDTSLPLHRVKVEYLGWGPEVDCMLPAVRIWITPESSFTIGASIAPEVWSDVTRSVQATDYLLQTEREWNQLLNSLK